MNWLEKLQLLPQSRQQNSTAKTSAQQELVRLDKKGEIVLSDGRFVTTHKIKIGHVLACQGDSDLGSALKLIALTTKIDDKTPSIEDVLNLDLEDFHSIMRALNK